MEAAATMMASSSSARNTGWPSVVEFYSHKDVFITGATGFMGKCLVEKLLRSVPDLGRLFILIRPKRGKPVKERIDAMLRYKAGKGMLRVMRCSEFGIADIVPVDLVNNMLICVGWVTGVNPTPQPIIYHYTSGTLNPINWISMYPLVISAYTNYPFDQIFRRPRVFKCRPASAWPWWHFLMHIIPGFLVDVLLRLVGKKPIMLNLYRKLGKAIDQLDYFTQNEWKWSHTNHDKLLSVMHEQDKKEFGFDIRDLNWDQYIKDYCMGTKQYLFNEDLTNIPIARRQIKRLRNIRYTFNIVMFLVVWRLLYFKSQIARDLWDTFVTLCVQSLVKLGIPLPSW